MDHAKYVVLNTGAAQSLYILHYCFARAVAVRVYAHTIVNFGRAIQRYADQELAARKYVYHFA